MTTCTCWMEYPNELVKRKNGKWICVDEYECVRPLRHLGEGGCSRKTMCVKKEKKNDKTDD